MTPRRDGVADDTRVEHVDVADRLRHVDAEISGRHLQPSGPAEPAQRAGSERPRLIVPEPRRVRVFLRGPGDLGEFSRLTVIHPVLPRPRVRRYS